MLAKIRRNCALIVYLFIVVLSIPCFSAEKKGTDVLAEIGKTTITRDAYNKRFEDFSKNANPQQVAQVSTPEGHAHFLNQLVEIKLLSNMAEKEKLNTGKKFENDCKEASLGVLASEYLNKLLKKVKIEDKDIKDYYDSHKKDFTEPTSYHFCQITLKTATEAALIKDELTKGKSFLETAKTKSTDNFKNSGGDRGFTSANEISPAILPVIKQMKKDTISAPIRTGKEAYVIVKLIETKAGKQKSFEEVSSDIRKNLTSSKQREAYMTAMGGIKKEVPAKINEDVMNLLKKPNLSKEDMAKTLMTIGKKEIKLSEVAASLNQIPAFLRPQILQGKGLSDLINQIASRNMATEYARIHFGELSKEFPEVEEQVENKFAIKALLDKELGNIKVPEKEIKEFYNKNLSQFETKAQIHAHHILVKTEKEAKEILETLKKDPTQFEKIAKEKSTCPSGKRAGGDLGMFGPGQMVPAFDKACQEAEVNKIVGPVKTKFGYHIIRVDSKTKPGHKKLEEVEPQIKRNLLGQKQKDAYLNLIKKLKKEYKVKIYEKKI